MNEEQRESREFFDAEARGISLETLQRGVDAIVGAGLPWDVTSSIIRHLLRIVHNSGRRQDGTDGADIVGRLVPSRYVVEAAQTQPVSVSLSGMSVFCATMSTGADAMQPTLSADSASTFTTEKKIHREMNG